MDLKKQTSLALPAAGLVMGLAHAGSAGIVVDYQFNTLNDTEGWAVLNNVNNLAADGDSLNGTATASSNDPQLTSGSVSLSTTEGWDTLIFRVREIDDSPAGPVSFNPIGVVATLGGSTFSNSAFVGVASDDDFYIVTLDISSLGTNDITSIRLDPIGGASSNSNSQTTNNTFEIDYIQISDVPEPSSLALLALGGLAMIRRRR